ncbi:hypothetical protein REPUB_Repub17cG0043500 [Reevesia pubescens]
MDWKRYGQNCPSLWGNKLKFSYKRGGDEIHGLSLGMIKEKVEGAIGGMLGQVDDVETKGESETWGRSLRLRVNIDMSKPLLRSTKVEFLCAMEMRKENAHLKRKYGNWLQTEISKTWSAKVDGDDTSFLNMESSALLSRNFGRARMQNDDERRVQHCMVKSSSDEENQGNKDLIDTNHGTSLLLKSNREIIYMEKRLQPDVDCDINGMHQYTNTHASKEIYVG